MNKEEFELWKLSDEGKISVLEIRLSLYKNDIEYYQSITPEGSIHQDKLKQLILEVTNELECLRNEK